jgi:hypothetical protein
MVYYFSITALNKEQDLIRDALQSEDLKKLIPKIPTLTLLMRGLVIAMIIIIATYLFQKNATILVVQKHFIEKQKK